MGAHKQSNRKTSLVSEGVVGGMGNRLCRKATACELGSIAPHQSHRMSKDQKQIVEKIADTLRNARDNYKAHFLIGAGCSKTAGVPLAGELVDEIKRRWPQHCRDVPEGSRYGAYMKKLTLNERRDLITKHLKNSKINWGQIALAQMIAEGHVSRVLTVNFDNVLARACGLLGEYPATYDFATAPVTNDDGIVSPAILHLHGQGYGIKLLNTDEETNQHAAKLAPILKRTLDQHPLVIIGYSGDADDVFSLLKDHHCQNNRIYWLGHGDSTPEHVRAWKEGKEYVTYTGGCDADRILMDIAKELDCWPPTVFQDPARHLLDEIADVVEFPSRADGIKAVDLLHNLRERLTKNGALLREKYQPIINVMAGRSILTAQVDAAKTQMTSGRRTKKWAEREAALLFEEGVILFLEMDEAPTPEAKTKLTDRAASKFAAALAIKPDKHEALSNWGVLLAKASEREGDVAKATTLREQAIEKYADAVAIKSDLHEALFNWGVLLAKASEREGDVAKATTLRDQAIEKFAAALAIKPDKHEALSSWGLLLAKSAERETDAARAATLRDQAIEKFAAALAIKPDLHEVISNWGLLLTKAADRESDAAKAATLRDQAIEKYAAVLAIKPDNFAVMDASTTLVVYQFHAAQDDGKRAALLKQARELAERTVAIAPTLTYNLACVKALSGDEAACRRNLEIAEQAGTLPDAAHLLADNDFTAFRDKNWFKSLLARCNTKDQE
jgi:hypothetical protein